MENLEQKIESILFFKGEPMQKKNLIEFLAVTEEDFNQALNNLENSLKNRGIVLMQKENEISLGTSKDFSDLIERLQKEELQKDLSKATMETLSIILYKNGVSRSEIDHIRGVNSSFILRTLSIRGLIEKSTDKEDSRRFIYKPTFELLGFMGVSKVEELPDYDMVSKRFQNTIDELKESEDLIAKENVETNT